jgi:hypothetical protein
MYDDVDAGHASGSGGFPAFPRVREGSGSDAKAREVNGRVVKHRKEVGEVVCVKE